MGGVNFSRLRGKRQSRNTYGRPRLHATLADEGWRVGGKRIARLMRAQGLRGVTRRKGTVTTVPADERWPVPDRVERDFTTNQPAQLYVAEITYVPTWAGFLYLAMVLDVFSRRTVGWRMATHLRTELVADALDRALWQRQPENMIHHSDQGCQPYSGQPNGKPGHAR
jgi:putative transposase